MRYRTILLLYLIFALLGLNTILFGQNSEPNKRFEFNGDFRFRVEHDWNSFKTDGSKREDRSRLRYRYRFGTLFKPNNHSSFGATLRSSVLGNPQDPHLTIGGAQGGFDLGQIGFEKIYYQYKKKNIKFWLGKNSIPIKKLNELFWNDNVLPEGIAFQYNIKKEESLLFKDLSFRTGHFIIKSNGNFFRTDSYLQVFQIVNNFIEKKISIFPSYYYFKNVGNFPNGLETTVQNYNIFHLGAQFEILQKPKISLATEYYHNAADYTNNLFVEEKMKDERNGWVISAKYGGLEKKGDWLIKLSYTQIQKYALIDYFAQNDWARWNYSSIGSNAGRLTNFKGFEFRLGYAIQKKYKLVLRAFTMKELVKTGNNKETGDRIRIDFDVSL